MARTLKPLSITFSEEMTEQVDSRIQELGLSRSAYLRQLVASDLEKSNHRTNSGSSSFSERFRSLEQTVELLKEKLEALYANEFRPVDEPPALKLKSQKPSPIDPIDSHGRARQVCEITEEELKS